MDLMWTDLSNTLLIDRLNRKYAFRGVVNVLRDGEPQKRRGDEVGGAVWSCVV